MACGFLALFHTRLTAALDAPVFRSILLRAGLATSLPMSDITT